MKKTKHCNECGSSDLRMTVVASGGGYAPDLLPGTHPWWTTGKLEVWICCTCGLFQYYVPEQALHEIAKSDKFTRV